MKILQVFVPAHAGYFCYRPAIYNSLAARMWSMNASVYNLRVAAVVVAIFTCTFANAATEVTSAFIADATKGWTLYHSGNVIGAISHFDRLTTSSRTEIEKAMAVEHGLQICRLTRDEQCFGKFFDQSIQLAKRAKSGARESTNFDFIQKFKVTPSTRVEAVNIMAVTAMLNIAEEANPFLEKIKDKSVGSWVMTPEFGEVYVDLQLELAEALSGDFSFSEARIALDRALAFILSADNPNPFYTARILAEIISQYAESADIVRAIMFYRASGDFVPNMLTRSIPELVKYRITEASLLQGVGDFKGSLAAAEMAIKGIQYLNVEPWQKVHLLAVATNDAIISNILLGDADAARRFLSQHPYAKQREFSAETIAKYQAFSRYVLLAMMLGDKDSLDVQKYLDYLGNITAKDHSYAVLIPLLRGFAAPQKSSERIKEFVAAGEAMVILSNKILEENEDATYLPDSSERFVLGLGLEALAKSSLSPRDKAAKALPMMEVLGRSLRTIEADAVEVIARQPTEAARREAHSRMRLNARQAEAQREGVKELVERLKSVTDNNKSMVYNRAARWPYSTIGIERARLRENSGKKSVRRPPDLDSLQKTLRDGEVYVHTQAALGNAAVHLCVSKTRAWYSRSEYAPDDLIHALSRLNHALDVSVGALPPLSSFPFDASVSLFNTFVKPVAPCLESAKHVIWRNSSDRIHFPVSVLLDGIPAGAVEEKSIPWFGRKYAISNVQSATSIIATRARPRSRDFDGTFLGIGDPKLYDSPGDRSESKVLRNVAKRRDGAPVVLEELPDTRDELLGIAKNLPERKNVLMREGATESKVRQQPLGSYRWINFATHGVIREEIPGLKESALLLSTGGARDELNDGLLTSSEIADLRLGADFVALSACNTANFDDSDVSSGVAGLTTAFALAGVPATLATLQPVDSYVAKEIVTRTFQNAHKHQHPPAHALQAAIKDFLATEKDGALKHPAYWSAFIVQGDGGSLPLSNRSAKIDRFLVEEGGTQSSAGRLLFQDKDKALYETYHTLTDEKANAKWFLRRVDPTSLSVLWAQDLEGAFNQARPVMLGQNLVVGGFLYPDRSGRSIPVVKSYSRDGRLNWQKKLNNSEYLRGAVSSLTTIGNNLLAVVWWADTNVESSNDEKKRLQRQIQLIELDPSGREVRNVTVPLWPGLGFTHTALAVSEKKIALYMGNTMDFGDEVVIRNLYSDPEICTPNFAGKAVLLDRSNLRTDWEKNVPGVFFQDIKPAGNDEFLAAIEIRHECQSSPNTAAVAKVQMDGQIGVIWSQEGAFGGRASALSIRGNDVLVVGNEYRSIDMHTSRPKNAASSSSDRGKSEKQKLSEVFVAHLDLKGKQRSVNWLTSGTSYHAADIAVAGEQILMSGTAGRSAMRMRATLPSLSGGIQ